MDILSNLTCSRVHSLGQCTSPAAKWDCSQKCSGELGRCNSHDALRARVFVTGVHGLGNNLFQIAVAIWYAETYGHRVVLQRDDQLLLTGTANMMGKQQATRPYAETILRKFSWEPVPADTSQFLTVFSPFHFRAGRKSEAALPFNLPTPTALPFNLQNILLRGGAYRSTPILQSILPSMWR